MEQRNVLMDFTGIYAEDDGRKEANITYLDCTDIQGSNMYCTPEAEAEIKERLRPYGVSGIHYLDSGNYHYITKFFLDKIDKPFSLVLFDFHNDMQIPLIHDLTSCGGWAGEVLRENKYLHQLIIVGPDQEDLRGLEPESGSKLICISLQELERDKAEAKLEQIDVSVPMYISIDKDVMARTYAVTNWNQGNMSLDMLKRLLNLFFIHCEVIGVDICGELSDGGPLPEYEHAERINSATNKDLYVFISRNIDAQPAEVVV